MHMYSAKNIVSLLNQNTLRVAQFLFPKGKCKGNEWCVGSVNGEAGDSLKICLEGDKIGVWCDFATGQSGDLLNLWCINRNKTVSEAILEVKQWLGIASATFEPQRKNNWVKPRVTAEVALDINSSNAFYLTNERKLTFETLFKYQILQRGDEIVFPYFKNGELALMKYLKRERLNGKKQMRVTSSSEPCLFGWQAIPNDARKLVLVEGEIDAMSLYEYGIDMAILSLPFGGGKGAKHQWLEHEFDRVSVFDEIFLCLDNDSEGNVAANELVERLGAYRCRIVQLPMKDANECLKAGIDRKQIQECFDNARMLDPDELKVASSYVEEVIDEFYPKDTHPMGYSFPWEKTRNNLYLRSGELSVWTGINGHGKSQIVGQIILNCMKQGAKVCIASLELKPKRLLARLTRQASGLRNPSEEYIRAIHDWYNNHLWIFDLVGTAKVKRLLEVFLYARRRYGIDVFVIDSLMKCGISEDDYNGQKALVESLCDFKNSHDCHIHLVVHPRKPNDENKIPGKLDMKGTGSITDLADNCFIVWRNKLKEEEINRLGKQHAPSEDLMQKFDCLLACDKQRNGEWEGKIALWFNRDSFQYLENYQHRPMQLVEYSSTNRIS